MLKPKSKDPNVIYIVEAIQLSGHWKAVAAPPEEPFDRISARRVIARLLGKYPHLRSRHLRIVKYERSDPIIPEE